MGLMDIMADMGNPLAAGAVRRREISKAQARIDSLVQPKYPISSLYGDNLGLAEQNASQGLSQQSLNAYNQQNQQNFASATNAILQGGGSINDIGKLYGQANTAEIGLIAQNEALRDKHLEQLYERRQEMAGQLTTKWRLDYYNRWKDQAAANAMLLNQAQKMPTGMETLANDVKLAGSIASLAGGGGVPQMPTNTNSFLGNDGTSDHSSSFSWGLQDFNLGGGGFGGAVGGQVGQYP